MIPFISRHLQQLHYERHYWLTRAEKRRALLLTSGLAASITILVLLWLLS